MTVRDPLGAAVAWLAHPFSVLGLALLLLNDHLLKQVWPGVVTGKLSDLAGMLMFPPLLAGLIALALPRARAKTLAVVALCLTGCGFSAMKFSWYIAELASSALTFVSGQSVVRADRTDLLVLPALALAWLAFRRASARPIASHPARVVRLLVLLPLALLGTAATSCGSVYQPPPVVSKGSDGSVWLKPQNKFGDFEYRSSVDGGLTFRSDVPAEQLVVLEQDCLGDTCYRVVRGDMLVQQRIGDGGWTTAWRLDPGRRHDLMAGTDSCGVRGKEFESQALVVLASPGGHVVLVSNGDDGLLRRDVSGEWTRIGWGTGSPPLVLSQGVLPGGDGFFSLAAIVLLLLIGGLGVTAIKAQAPWRVSRFALLFALAAAVAICLDTLVTYLGETAHPAFVVFAAVWSVVALGLGVLYAVHARWSLRPLWIVAMVLFIAVCAGFTEPLRIAESFAGLLRTGLVAAGFVVVALIGLAARPHPYALVAEPPYPEVEAAS